MIELEGFETVLPNQAYTRDAVFVLPNGTEIDIKRVLLLSRFTEPDQSAVIKYAQQKVEIVEECEGYLTPEQIGPVEEIILDLTKPGRIGIVEGDPGIIKILGLYCPAPKLELLVQPKDFLNIDYGLIPTGTLEKKENPDLEWFNSLFASNLRVAGLGHEYDIQLLCRNGLPKKETINSYINGGVDSSDLIRVSRMGYNKDDIRSMVNATYSGDFSYVNFSLLEDFSEKVIENAAIQMLKGFKTYEQSRDEKKKKPAEDKKILN
jgi:hypothetical protein